MRLIAGEGVSCFGIDGIWNGFTVDARGILSREDFFSEEKNAFEFSPKMFWYERLGQPQAKRHDADSIGHQHAKVKKKKKTSSVHPATASAMSLNS